MEEFLINIFVLFFGFIEIFDIIFYGFRIVFCGGYWVEYGVLYGVGILL